MPLVLKLKEARVEAGLSQKQVAEMLEMSLKAYQGWEQGKSVPSLEELGILAKLYCTNLHALAGLDVNLTQGFDDTDADLMADEDGFWGHVGIKLKCHELVIWYPVSLRTSDTLRAGVNGAIDPEALTPFATLDNRLIRLRLSQVSRLYLVGDGCDLPGDGSFTQKCDALHGYSGHPLEVYEAMIALLESQLTGGDCFGAFDPAIIEHAQQVISQSGLGGEEILAQILATRVIQSNGEDYSFRSDTDCILEVDTLIDTIDIDFLPFVDHDNGHEVYFCEEEVALLQMPLSELLKAEDLAIAQIEAMDEVRH